MEEKTNSRNTPYEGERNTEPSKQAGTSNAKNNNIEVSTPGAGEPNVEQASDSGIGDRAINDRRLTDFTSNHSADA